MDYKDINDYEIIYMVKEKEIDKDLLFCKYRPLIDKIATKYYKAINYGFIDKDDLIQEGFVALDNAIDAYNDEASLFYTFASICIKRHILTYIRKVNKSKDLYNNTYSYNNDLGDKNYLEVLESKSEYPHEEIINTAYLDKIRDIKNELSFLQASVFELRFNGFKIKEIAELLDITISNVNSVMRKVRIILNRYGVNQMLIGKY